MVTDGGCTHTLRLDERGVHYTRTFPASPVVEVVLHCARRADFEWVLGNYEHRFPRMVAEFRTGLAITATTP
jgi:hypothetical protein